MAIEGQNDTDRPGYLRPKEASQHSGLAPTTLAKFRMKGRPYGEGPPFIKVGRVVLYRREDLDHWLHQRRVPAE
jgi:hypothetical protein